MDIERDMFANCTIEKEKLIEYGFRAHADVLVYSKRLPEEGLTILVKYNGEIIGRIEDSDTHEEYTNFRLEKPSGFSAEVRKRFIDLLLDIREKCGKNQFFRFEQARRMNQFIYETYGDFPEFLWPKLPAYAVFRHRTKKKWYALIGGVPLNKVDHFATSVRQVEVLNVKVGKRNIDDLLSQTGYYPAYHMNKKSWVSIILDDTLQDDEVKQRICESYECL